LNKVAPTRACSLAGGLVAAASRLSLAAKSGRVMTSAGNAMSAWVAPQNSAQTPRKLPVRVGSSTSRLVRPGIMSILPPRLGIQKEWMTSGLTRVSSVRAPAGKRISLAVTTVPAALR
jgi:hypothetical protein